MFGTSLRARASGFFFTLQLFRFQTSIPPYAVRGVALDAFFLFPSLWEAARPSGSFRPGLARRARGPVFF